MKQLLIPTTFILLAISADRILGQDLTELVKKGCNGKLTFDDQCKPELALIGTVHQHCNESKGLGCDLMKRSCACLASLEWKRQYDTCVYDPDYFETHAIGNEMDRTKIEMLKVVVNTSMAMCKNILENQGAAQAAASASSIYFYVHMIFVTIFGQWIWQK